MVFENYGKSVVVVPFVVQKSGGQHHQQRAQTFSATPHDVASYQSNKRHTRVQILIDLFLDALQVIVQFSKERVLLMTQVFGGAFEGQDWRSSVKVKAGKKGLSNL